MRVLLTGASSFTGTHFALALRAARHDVVATLTAQESEYRGLRGERVQLLREAGVRIVPASRFGTDPFLVLFRDAGPFDLLAHHAADVTDYKSPAFDVVRALANNTFRLDAVLEALGPNCAVLLTGSVFEQREGAGSEGLPAFSPYGLSKGLTADVFAYRCGATSRKLGKFVIPNPFGPYEEPRFTTYLVRNWMEGRRPAVNTPAYVRDNIHVSLLAKAYSRYAEEVAAGGAQPSLHPSGYPESQGAFALRFAGEMRPRLGLACDVELRAQTEFGEPRVRINTDLLEAADFGWDESKAWDELAAWYRTALGRGG